jgi:alpha-tubulin suppressor-like RCC1 family protein
MTRLRRGGLEPGVGLLALLIALIVLPPALPAATRVIAWGTNNFGQLDVPPGLTNVISIATAPYAAIALTAEGRLVPWGDNRNGQLNIPGGLPPVSAVALGFSHGNVLLPDSTVLGWGSGQGAQVPFGLTNVVSIAADGSRSVAVKADGTVVSWGDSYPVPADATNIVAVACGSSHTLGLRADGTVIAWGSNHFGESTVPPGLSNIVKIAAGSFHSFALKADGTLHAWGFQATTHNQPPTDVTHWGGVAADWFNLGLLTTGTVRAWGNVEPIFTTVPPSVTNALAVAGGGGFGLALLGEGRPYLWKSPTDLTVFSGAPAWLEVKALGTAPVRYQWRRGNTDLSGETNPVLTIAAAQTSQAGTYRVVVTDSLGVSISEPATLTVLESPPVILVQPTNRVALAGRPFNLQVEVEGSLPITYEWHRSGTAVPGVSGPVIDRTNAFYLDAGDYEVVVANAFGARTSAVARVDFVPVAAWGSTAWVPQSLTNAVDVLAGNGYVVALRADGTVTNWGGGSLPGTHTAGMSNIVELIRGGGLIAGLTARGDIQFAQPPTFSRESMGLVPATALPAATAVKGDQHLTAINAHGRAVSWGNNTYGQTNVPAHATNLVALAAGYHHTLALRADGQLVAWGRNNAGQLNLPEGATNIVAIWSGAEHSYARRADGTLFGWGVGAQLPAVTAPVAAMGVGQTHTLVLQEDGATSGWKWHPFAFGFAHEFPAGLTNYIALSAGYEQSAALVGSPQPVVREVSGTLSIYSGETLLLRANAVGQPPLRYQWRRNGAEISGATNFYFSIPAALAGDTAQYEVTVFNAAGTHTSPAASATVVDSQPLLTSHPTNQVRLFHGTAHFSAGVAGSKPVHLQWQRNGVDLPGETNLSLVVPALRFTQAGTYRLVASNAFGVALSDPAELTVVPVALFGDQNPPLVLPTSSLSTGLTNPPARVTNAMQIAAGGHHLLVVLDDGSPLAWGSNEKGQLEIPTGLPPFTTLDGGGWHSVGLLETGELVAWGLFLNTRQAEPNLLGFSAASTGVSMLYGDGRIKDVAYAGTAVSHAPAALWNGAALGNGSASRLIINHDGTLALWSDSTSLDTIVPEYVRPHLTNLVAITAGDRHYLALRADGTMLTWGYHPYGQVNQYGELNLPPGLNDVIAIEAGLSHSVALRRTGELVAWGRNHLGQAAIPPDLPPVASFATMMHGTAVLIREIPPRLVSPVATYQRHVGTALRLLPRIVGSHPLTAHWYRNGQLLPQETNLFLARPGLAATDAGDYSVVLANAHGSVSNHVAQVNVTDVPPQLLATPESVQVSFRQSTNLFAAAKGTFPLTYQWLFNGEPIPDATNATLALPQLTPWQAGWYAVVASNYLGAVTSRLASVTVGPVLGWGNGQNGRTNNPAGLTNALALAAGYGHSAALKGDGTVMVWGFDQFGALQPPAGLSNVVQLLAAEDYCLALLADGTVRAWGTGGLDATFVPDSFTNVVALSVSSFRKLALRRDGSITGNFTIMDAHFEALAARRDFAAISAGYYHSLAVLTNGTVIAWGGQNQKGETNVPPGLSGVISVAAGFERSVALRRDGTVAAWGGFDPGQLTAISNLTEVSFITPNFAVRRDGTVASFSGTYGQGWPDGLTGVLTLAEGANHTLALLRHPEMRGRLPEPAGPGPIPFLVPTLPLFDYLLEHTPAVEGTSWAGPETRPGYGQPLPFEFTPPTTGNRFYRLNQTPR